MYQWFRGFAAAVAVAASVALVVPPAQAQTPYNVGQLPSEVRAAAQAARTAQTRAVASATAGRAEADRAQAAAARARQGARGYAVRQLSGTLGGRRVEGEFNGTHFQGLAVDTTIDGAAVGDIYAGRWSAGVADGPGVYTYALNSNNETQSLRYEGDNGDGNAHGYGVYLWVNGDRYEGQFANNEHSGHGVLTWANGERYEGQWADGDRNGWGVQWDANGRVIHAGRWSSDRLVGSSNAPSASASTSGPLPPSFVLSAAQEVLAGDVEVLIEVFVWGESAQGHDYWSAIHSSGRLTAESRAILRDWVARYQAGERGASAAPASAGPMPEGFLPRVAEEVLNGNTERLINAFVWGETQQGHDYWQRIYDAGGRIPAEAAGYLREWIGRADRGERPPGSSGGGK
ncbi:MAG: hypothetical protein KF700_06885 [Hyphomonadaceae bacterium]|nr:hypothetical protein [Hyphomonadaceae bacterium]